MADIKQSIKIRTLFIFMLLLCMVWLGCGREDTGDEIYTFPGTIADRPVVNGEKVKEGTQAQTIELLRKAIEGFDFGETQPNIKLTEEEERAYLEGYLKILRSEIPIKEYWNDREVYYKELYRAGVPYWEYLEARDKTEYPYGLYYYDWDGDGAPELGMYAGWLYIIKYEPGDTAGRILWEFGDEWRWPSDYLGGFIGAGVWFHDVSERRIIDYYERPDAEGRWGTRLSFTQVMEPEGPYYTVYVKDLPIDAGKAVRVKLWSEWHKIRVGEKDFKELSQAFYTAAEYSLKPFSLEELFGNILIETDPLLETWNGSREYDYLEFYDNPDLPYADDKTYEAIKAAYERVDFTAEYETGDLSLYEEYKEKYWELLQSDTSLTNRETGEEIPIAEIMTNDRLSASNGREVTYALFDADGDMLPELAVYKQADAWYVIDYDAKTQDYSLWFSEYTYHYFMIGTRKVMWTGDWNYEFYQLDENGDIELMTHFSFRGIRENVMVCLVGMPDYSDDSKEDVITEEMKQFGFYVRVADRWYFRVTESQFAELMEPYWEAYEEQSWDAWDAISLPYNEFFAEFIN
ncbi:MAG: hypothetical protein J1E83_02510 [Lachnospiraceae bacterium]|nr:hypothetical protein [Lachnospiraceae bacterium]